MDEEKNLNTEETAVPREGITEEILKKAKYVSQVPIFSSLKEEDHLKIAEIVEEVYHGTNHVIFHEGDVGDAVYIVIDGKVKVVKKQDEGDERTLAVFRDGDFFGEMAVIEEQPRTATAVVLEDCVLYKITKQNFSFVMRLNPGITLKIMRYMSERVRQSSAVGRVAEKEAKIITLFSPKGGIGKSMLGVNIGVALAKNPELKIALVDLDLEFGSFEIMLKGAQKCSTIVDMLKEVQLLSYENISPFMHKVKDNLHLMAAPNKPEEAELVTVQQIKEIIEVLSGHYDYIIIDTATTFTETTLVAMDMAWKLLILIGPDFVSLENTVRAIHVLKNLDYDTSHIHLVMNMVGGSDHDLTPDDITSFISKMLKVEIKVQKKLPYDYKTAFPSVSNGKPYVDSNPDSILAVRTLELVNAMCNQKLDVPKTAEADGLLGKLTGFFGK
jgi:MinD-like ATPase involved in chromosome partitioning or flagellar assembly